jgi:hypothetical protein
MFFVRFSEKAEIICLYNFDRLNRLKQKWCVVCGVFAVGYNFTFGKGGKIDL